MNKKERWLYPLLLILFAIVHILLFFKFRKRISKTGVRRVFDWLREVKQDFKTGISKGNCFEKFTRYIIFFLPTIKRTKKNKKKGGMKRKLAAFFSVSGINWDD